MPVPLDPAGLPKLDILSLARSGLILRAERETPEGGLPVFLTRAGWKELIAHHRRDGTGDKTRQEAGGEESEEQTAARLLPALERISARLLQEAAQAAKARQTRDAALFTLETDLFPSSPQTRIVLVADKTHPVACALIGTPAHLTQLLADTKTEAGQA